MVRQTSYALTRVLLFLASLTTNVKLHRADRTACCSADSKRTTLNVRFEYSVLTLTIQVGEGGGSSLLDPSSPHTHTLIDYKQRRRRPVIV